MLGFTMIEDQRISGPAIGRMVGLADRTMRILHLRSSSGPDGLTGLYSIEEGKPPEVPRPNPGSIKLGQVVVVVYTDHMDGIEPRIRERRYTVVSPLKRYTKEQPSAYTPVGTYSEVIFLDPDGAAVNVVQHEPIRPSSPGLSPDRGSRGGAQPRWNRGRRRLPHPSIQTPHRNTLSACSFIARLQRHLARLRERNALALAMFADQPLDQIRDGAVIADGGGPQRFLQQRVNPEIEDSSPQRRHP